MADDPDRRTKIKNIMSPDGSTMVPFPCLLQGTLTDQKSLGQDISPLFNNTGTNTERKVRVVTGMSEDDNQNDVETIEDPDGTWKDGASKLAVEKCDRFSTNDQKSFGQDSDLALADPRDPNFQGPLDDDRKTRKRYYTQPPDAALPDVTVLPSGATAWIQVEQYLTYPPVDQKSFGQEADYLIFWPDDNSDIDNAEGTYDPDDTGLVDPTEPGQTDGDGNLIGWRVDPLQTIVDVSWAANFVLFGYDGSAVFITYSVDGAKWSSAASVPSGGSIRDMTYGGGAWLVNGNGNDLYKSTDLFKTWKKIAVSYVWTGAVGRQLCYGRPIDAKKGSDALVIKNGVFAALSRDTSFNITIMVSKDIGETWSVAKTINTSGLQSFQPQFITCIGGIFYACATTQKTPESSGSPPVPEVCKVYTSRDGLTWDAGTEILHDVTNHVVNNDPFVLPTLAVQGMVYRPKSKTFVVSGSAFGDGSVVFYAQGSDPKHFGSAALIGAFDPLLRHYNILNPNTPVPPTTFWNDNSPHYEGGWLTSVGDNVIITIQKLTQLEDGVDWSFPGAGGFAPRSGTNFFLTTSKDEDGVIGPDFSQRYFSGNTVDRNILVQALDDIGGVSVYKLEPYRGSNVFQAIANGYKDKNVPTSVGTFLWTRFLVSKIGTDNPSELPTGAGPGNDIMANTKFELWRSQDGVSFTKISHPKANKDKAVIVGLALGATPSPTT